jgi:hypothetical protein
MTQPEALDLSDAARFLPDDEAAAVAASFACPVCLRAPTWVLVSDPKLDEAQCKCAECELMWTVSLNLAQGMRLALAPPHGLMVATATSPGLLPARVKNGREW